jgi:hypothetical protein
MFPFALTDSQLNIILAAAEPLAPSDRARFLVDVAERLRGQVIGDGLIARVCRDARAAYWRPPNLDERRLVSGKWER